MILTDDNFASIEAAVEEGRGIFDNLTKFIVCVIPSNAGEALLLLSAIFLGLPLPALPVQLLWVNLTTSVLLDLALVFEPREPNIMRRPPRDPQKPLITFALFMRTGLVTLMMLAGGMFLFLFEFHGGDRIAEARTAVINLIVVVEIAYLFNCRSLTHSMFHIGLFTNPKAIYGALGLIALQLLYTYTPVMNRLFESTPISLACWMRIASVAVLTFVVVEIEKWIRFGRGSDHEANPE